MIDFTFGLEDIHITIDRFLSLMKVVYKKFSLEYFHMYELRTFNVVRRGRIY